MRHGDQYRVRVLVCEECHDWMNQKFEGRATELVKPLVAGATLTIEPGHADFLAGYLTKTLLLLGRWPEFPDDIKIPQSILREFRKSEVSPFASISIGCRRWPEPAGTSPHWAQINLQYVSTKLPAGFMGGWQAIDKMIIHYLIDFEQQGRVTPTLVNIERCYQAGILREVLPRTSGSFSWPPTYMTTATYRRLVDTGESSISKA